MIKIGYYKLKEEFFPLLNIAINQWKMRKDDLLHWLSNFYDYEIVEGKPLRIKIIEVYGEYQPLPRKLDGYNMAEKVTDYKNFTIAALGNEFKPNSKSKVAREAIQSFGNAKYGHTSREAVARRFVSPVFEQYGESDGKYHWVWYKTYELASQEDIDAFKTILKEEKAAEEDVINAFYASEGDEEILKTKECYRKAICRAKEELGDFLVRVPQWRLKQCGN